MLSILYKLNVKYALQIVIMIDNVWFALQIFLLYL